MILGKILKCLQRLSFLMTFIKEIEKLKNAKQREPLAEVEL